MTWMMPERLPIPRSACCLLAFSNQYRYHITCAILPNLGASPGGSGDLGKGLLAGPKRAIGWNSSNCDAKPAGALPCESRDHCPRANQPPELPLTRTT